jgi:cytochrome b6-f complex iron-sulfur subunit
VAASSIAAAAAAVGAVVDTVTSRGPARGVAGGDQTLIPNTGQWHTVGTSADLAEGGIQSFDLGSLIGFVTRTTGHVGAVSGVCTHQGCRLALNAAARRLDCPCHSTSFAVSGELLAHQLPVPPRALPQLQVREAHGDVQVYAPTGRLCNPGPYLWVRPRVKQRWAASATCAHPPAARRHRSVQRAPANT